MVHAADEDAGAGLVLSVATSAEVRIADGQHFGIDRAVGIVASSAAFAQGRVFEHKRFGLFAMTLRAGFVQSRHRQAAGRFHDVLTVGIMTLDTVHSAFEYGMMLREAEFSAGFQMALETGFGFLARIEDKFLEAAGPGVRNVFAAGTVTRFTTALAGHFRRVKVQSRVRAAGEAPGDVRVTIQTGLVADDGCAFDLQRRDQRAIHRGAGIDEQNRPAHARRQRESGQRTQELHLRLAHEV